MVLEIRKKCKSDEFQTKGVVLLIVYISLFSFLVAIPAKAQWEGAEISRLTYDQTQTGPLAFAIDENDKLYLIYYQGRLGVHPYKLFFVFKEANEEWSQPEEIGDSAYQTPVIRPVAAYDTKRGIIHLVYGYFGHIAPHGELFYTNSQVNDWEVTKIDSSYTYIEHKHPNMGLDSSGNVHLVWSQEFDSSGYSYYKVMYMTNHSGQWIKQQVSPELFLGYMGAGPSYLSVQQDGTAHIIYDAGIADSNYVCHVYNDTTGGSTWITDTLVYPLPYYGYGFAFAVDSQNNLHLILTGSDWFDSNKNFVWYYFRPFGSQEWQEPVELSQHGGEPLFYIDQKDSVHLVWKGAYQQLSFNHFYAKKKNGNWESYEFLDGTYHPDWFRFVIDSNGKGCGVFQGSKLLLPDDSIEVYIFSSSTSVKETSEDQKVEAFRLYQNYPNPFNTSTYIWYQVSKRSTIQLNIYDILGQKVRTLVNGFQEKGIYGVYWDGKNNKGKEVSSGVYFCKLKAGSFSEIKKLVFIK